jgi:hypothetical protein
MRKTFYVRHAILDKSDNVSFWLNVNLWLYSTDINDNHIHQTSVQTINTKFNRNPLSKFGHTGGYIPFIYFMKSQEIIHLVLPTPWVSNRDIRDE